MTEMVMVMSSKNKYGRDVRGGLFSCGAGWDGAMVKIRGAGRGGKAHKSTNSQIFTKVRK